MSPIAKEPVLRENAARGSGVNGTSTEIADLEIDMIRQAK
jgi:hypothetical protein